MLFGIVYIPPEYTFYSSNDAFNELQNEYANFSRNYKYISLLGDFNGRTADDDDFIFMDELIYIFILKKPTHNIGTEITIYKYLHKIT